jgi:hypothetical protein
MLHAPVAGGLGLETPGSRGEVDSALPGSLQEDRICGLTLMRCHPNEGFDRPGRNSSCETDLDMERSRECCAHVGGEHEQKQDETPHG